MRERSLTLKNYTSSFLKITAWIYLSFPLLYLILLAIVFDLSPAKFVNVLLSPGFYLTSFWAVLGGYGLWQMVQWGWYIFSVANLFLVYETALIVANYADTNNRFIALGILVLLVFLVSWRVQREVKVPYFLPRIRWWETDPAKRLSIPVDIRIHVDQEVPEFSGSILDLSLLGCFVKLQRDLTPDQWVELKFSFAEVEVVVPGNVVWCTPSRVTHPKGVGIKFSAIDRRSRRRLRVLLGKLRQDAHYV